jgi:hypothetical protein
MELSKIKNLELETVEIEKVKLDVYFTYDDYFGFRLHSVEDITGTQNLYYLLEGIVLDKIVEKLTDMYRGRGWL